MGYRISVIMPVHNGERFLRQAIDSILNQTCRDFELLIVDDGSTDKTADIISSYGDRRFRIIRNIQNLGLVPSLQLGLSKAQGGYIVRLDADDVALNDRFDLQAAYLDANPDVVLVDSVCELIDETNSHLGWLRHSGDWLTLRWQLHLHNPIVHSSVMFRRVRALEVGGYDTKLLLGEDFDLWSKLSVEHTIVQIPEVLTKYRLNTLGLTRKLSTTMRQSASEVVCRNVFRLTKTEISGSIASCLQGESSNPKIVSEAYRVYWLCLQAFHAQQRVPSNHRPLFEAVLRDVLSLARQDEAQRFRALAIASRYAARYAPLEFASPHFLNFAAKIISPPSWRRLFRRAVPRKAGV